MRRCAPQKRGSNARPGIRCAHRGVATTEPTSKRRLWISTKRWASTRSISPSVSRAMPTAAFNSSVSPSAQNTAPSLGPRAPLKSIEVPRSPVRVYTDTRRVCSLAGGTGEGSEQEFFYRQAHARAPCRGGAGTHEVAIAPWIWPLAAAGIEWQESGSAACLQFRWALAARHKVLDSMRRGGPQVPTCQLRTPHLCISCPPIRASWSREAELYPLGQRGFPLPPRHGRGGCGWRQPSATSFPRWRRQILMLPPRPREGGTGPSARSASAAARSSQSVPPFERKPHRCL